jgi:drug/metabolite transporter (DMT)-like permease
MNLSFRYPEGLVILLGIGIAVLASYVLPTTGYSGSVNLNWLQLSGIGIMFLGIVLVIWEDRRE